jgi:hypothetical protein
MSPAQVFRARGRLAFAIALVVFLGTVQRPSAAGIQIFTATLTGAQQVPAFSSSGTGVAYSTVTGGFVPAKTVRVTVR